MKYKIVGIMIILLLMGFLFVGGSNNYGYYGRTNAYFPSWPGVSWNNYNNYYTYPYAMYGSYGYGGMMMGWR